MIQINIFLVQDFATAIVKETPEKWWRLGQKKKWGTWSGDCLGVCLGCARTLATDPSVFSARTGTRGCSVLLGLLGKQKKPISGRGGLPYLCWEPMTEDFCYNSHLFSKAGSFKKPRKPCETFRIYTEGDKELLQDLKQGSDLIRWWESLSFLNRYWSFRQSC